MNPTNRRFGEQLLKVEQVTPALKQRYDQEIQAMLEKPLMGIRRWSWLAAAIGGLGFAVWFITLAITLPEKFPWLGRLRLVAGAMFGIGWAIVGIRVFRRGSLHLKVDPGIVAGMTWVFVLLLVILFGIAAPDTVAGLRMILFGLVFLLIGAVVLIRHAIEQSELKSREKLLEIEYRLAEMMEVLKSDSPESPESKS